MAANDIVRSLKGQGAWFSTGRNLARIAAMICAVGLAACSPLENMLGAKGQSVADRGIGGTGISGDESGIGGTGIIGTITAFGSIIVNGLEVEFDSSTSLLFDGAPGTTSSLKVGQLVAVEAATESNQLIAQSIAVHSAVSGPISSLSPLENTLMVLGQSITLDDGVLTEGSPSQKFQQLAVGQWVTVSGLRKSDGIIAASLIEPRPAGGLVSIRGLVESKTSDGFTVGGQSIIRVDNTILPDIGRSVFVVGRLIQSDLQPEQIEVIPSVPFNGRMNRLSLEGYVDALGNRLDANGSTISLDGARSLRGTPELAAGARITVEAHFSTDGVLEFEEIFQVEPATSGAGTGAFEGLQTEPFDREPSLMRR